VLTWFRAGFGDNMDQKLKRTVPCESASDLVKPDIETLATLTRAIAGRRQVKVNYLSLTSGVLNTRRCVHLLLADTGLRWHLRAYDRERGRFADFALTRIVKAKAFDHAHSSRRTD
jgi:predicted DNA-binding transcriptional regulator YafY